MPARPLPDEPPAEPLDLAHVKGHEAAKRALEVAAAGNHGVLLIGPRSGGKTLLARCLPGLLPPPTEQEAVEIAETYQRAKLDPPPGRPFRAPHQGTRPLDLIGRHRPGEVELAGGGVLLLDDLAAFGRRSLRALRAALEPARGPEPGSGAAPAVRCLLVATMASCACGHLHDRRRECNCTPSQLARYWRPLEELFLDLVHLHVEVPAVWLSELRGPQGESSRQVAKRVREARERQRGREGQTTWNAHLRPWALPAYCEPDPSGRKLLDTAYEQLGLTIRTVAVVLRVARTLADLAGSETIRAPHVAEAVQFRSLPTRPGRQRRGSP